MTKKHKLIGSAVLALTLALSPLSALADSKEKPIDEMWGTPIFVYGNALTESQKQETARILGLTDEVKYEEINVSGEDMVRLLGRGNPKSNMFSSAVIEHNKNAEGGIFVEVVTPNNITAVTQTQYANALITAGAEDVSVKVGSPVAVTGQSALTGIYKAYEINGVELDKDRMEVAQQEIEVTSAISKENVNEEKFNTELLTKTMVDIKEQVSEEVLGGETITEVVAKEIITNAVENNGLDQYITEEHVDKLVTFAMDYSETDAAISQEVLDQLDTLKEDALEKAKEFATSIGEKWEDVDKEGIWEGIKSFFNGIFSFFADLFSSKEEAPTADDLESKNPNNAIETNEAEVIDESIETTPIEDISPVDQSEDLISEVEDVIEESSTEEDFIETDIDSSTSSEIVEEEIISEEENLNP